MNLNKTKNEKKIADPPFWSGLADRWRDVVDPWYHKPLPEMAGAIKLDCDGPVLWIRYSDPPDGVVASL